MLKGSNIYFYQLLTWIWIKWLLDHFLYAQKFCRMPTSKSLPQLEQSLLGFNWTCCVGVHQQLNMLLYFLKRVNTALYKKRIVVAALMTSCSAAKSILHTVHLQH